MTAAAASAKSICLVTSGNLASNPRLVKEASALRQAGYNVRIVAADIIPALSQFDVGLISSLECRVERVAWGQPRSTRLFRSIRQRLARALAALFRARIPLSIASRAHHALTPALARAAAAERADLYLAHNLAALPAAAYAASKHGAKLGFDAEDYHCGESGASPGNALELRIRRRIEGELLPRCAHLTSASPLITEAYAADYGVKMTTVLNVFPLGEAPKEAKPPASGREQLPSLYWFSQTIGEGRGLEQIVAAMAIMRIRVRLVLRGNPAEGYQRSLMALAHERGGNDLGGRIDFLSVARPGEMVHLAASYDLGLALELAYPINRDICLTNKAFTYLLAGVPVLLSRTRAQVELASDLGEAAMLVDLLDPQGVADTLDSYLNDPAREKRARAAAWRLGRERFNWEIEARLFLLVIANPLDGKATIARRV